MTLKIFIVSIITLSAVCWVPVTGECREVKKYSIEQFMKTVSIGGSSFSSDEKSILFSGNQSGIYNAFVVPVTGGDPSQLTFSKQDSVFALSFLPTTIASCIRATTGAMKSATSISGTRTARSGT